MNDQTKTENLDSIMRRIEKLLAIANHERSDANEAAAAAGMAERIMRKYQIEQSDIIVAQLKKGDDLTTANVTASAKTNGTPVKVVPTWAGFMAVAVSRLNECGVRGGRMADGQACVTFFGYVADVQISSYMMTYLLGTVNRLCNDFKATPEYAMGGRALVNSYRQGVAVGITRKINELAEAKKVEQAVVRSAGTSLMVVKEQAIAERFGEMKTRATKTKVARGGAFYQGVADGKAVSINTAITSSGNVKTLN